MNEFKRILVPLDGSPLTEKALPLAATIARKHRSQLILWRALRFFRLSRGAYQEIHPGSEAEAQKFTAYQEAKSYMETWHNDLEAQGYNVCSCLCFASPVEGMVNTAKSENIDLIIMVTDKYNSLTRLIFGSVTDEVVQRSHCPVLLVKTPEENAPKLDGKRLINDWWRFQNMHHYRFFDAPSPSYDRGNSA